MREIRKLNQPEIGERLGEQIREIAWSAHSSPRGRVGNISQFSCSLCFFIFLTMWRAYKSIRPGPGFNIDQAPTTHPHTAELFAVVRNDGRIIDHNRVVMGGNSPLEASFKLGRVYDDPVMSDWTIHIQKFPRDLAFRRGLLSTTWANLYDWVASRDASVMDETGRDVSPANLLKRAKDADDGPELAAVRWALVLNDQARLCLNLQCLPASAAQLNSKPSLKR